MEKRFDLEKDIRVALQNYPQLKKHESNDSCFLEGELELKDNDGEILESFSLKIEFPATYPFCYPMVQETSNKIPKDLNWHCNQDGTLCITAKPIELFNCKQGINLTWFIENKLLPHLALQLLRKENGDEYLVGEYSHYDDGIVEAFMDICETPDKQSLCNTLKWYFQLKTSNRNDPCFCGSKKKFKKCHLKKFLDLDYLGRDYVLKEAIRLKLI